MRKTIGRISNGKYVSDSPPAVSRIQEIIDSRQSPSLNTDTRYFAGLGTADPFEGMSEPVKQLAIEKAAKAGVNILNKRYVGSLATESCDPKAWVENRGDMLRVAREKNLSCEGIVTNKVEINAEPRSTYEPAADILEDRTIEILDAQGAPDIVSRKEFEIAEDKAYNSLVR